MEEVKGSNPFRSTKTFLSGPETWVVFEVAEAIGLAFDEFHFVVKALGDALS